MVKVETLASYEVRQYLNTIAQPWDRSRRYADGYWWERRPGGEWATYELVSELGDRVRPDGRRPDMVIDNDTVELFGKLDAARSSQGDINDAMRGLEPVPAEGVNGAERLDYQVPVKNADGTLSKYGKRLMDLHGPALRVEQEISEKFSELRGA